ncbi:MAG TPA: pyridoxal-phosphate dependent enzyme [Thermoplasmata archaeon]|nr:pyridoxal-phosphate dependent enzyme [Thermoplasmata archaeon]
MANIDSVSLEAIYHARKRLGSLVLRTPLIPLNDTSRGGKVYLKLENLQPTGSFKVRGAGNSILAALDRGSVKGVYTTSAGNMAQALAWHAQRMGVPCTTIVPDTAPQAKLAGIRRFGAEIIQLPWDDVWNITLKGAYAPLSDRLYVPPFNHPDMIAGNGTIGAEIFEDLPDVDSVYVPIGGGGLICGIASALRALQPSARVIACEPETAAPYTASLKAGTASQVDRKPSFVDGSGASSVFPEMWIRLNGLVKESRVVTLVDTASAIRVLFEKHRVVAEGAAGTALAAASLEDDRSPTRVAVISGGNIDPAKLMTILSGSVP